jgi:Tfp pilus assembly protein PilF
VQLAPDLREVWTSLAQIYQMAGRSDDAARTQERAAALPEKKDPQH